MPVVLSATTLATRSAVWSWGWSNEGVLAIHHPNRSPLHPTESLYDRHDAPDTEDTISSNSFPLTAEEALRTTASDSNAENECVMAPRRIYLPGVEVAAIASGSEIICHMSNVSVGMFHCHALLDSGHLYSWGRSANSRLGFSSKKDFIPFPTLVRSDLRFTQVACGHHHSIAITDTGTLT